jgi:hypothetical protein
LEPDVSGGRRRIEWDGDGRENLGCDRKNSAQLSVFGGMNQFKKTYRVCGSEFQGRKKWQNVWHQVKYCSRACRKVGLTEGDIKLEKVTMEILHSAKAGTSICPSQAARKLAGDDDANVWPPLMEPKRRALRRLAHRRKIQIMQGGKEVNPSTFKGPIRLKLKI